jgi:hypothetical protein
MRVSDWTESEYHHCGALSSCPEKMSSIAASTFPPVDLRARMFFWASHSPCAVSPYTQRRCFAKPRHVTSHSPLR